MPALFRRKAFLHLYQYDPENGTGSCFLTALYFIRLVILCASFIRAFFAFLTYEFHLSSVAP